jgi:putative CocE/NonD family hydrolase
MSAPSPVSHAPFLREHRVATPARDGVVLRASVHRADEPRPVVLVRNPYGEPLTRNVPVAVFLDAGFAVVLQDCRGCGESEGTHVPFENEEEDTLDAIAWCARQEWSTGEVSMYGASYSGMVQLAAAGRAPEALRAIIPIVAPADYFAGVAYRGGAFQLGQLTGWYTMKGVPDLVRRGAAGEDVGALRAALGAHAANPAGTLSHLPVREAPFVSQVLPTWRRWSDHPRRDEYWRFSYGPRRTGTRVPALHIGGWFDLFLGGTVDNFRTLREGAATEYARAGQRLIIGPWSHVDQTGTVGELAFGAGGSAAALGLEQIEVDFLRAAREGAVIPGPAVRVYVMGSARWRTGESWPLEGTRFRRWYLRDGGRLTPDAPGEDAAAVGFDVDPLDPTPTVGGQTLMFGGRDGGAEWGPGPRDQSPLDGRTDIARFVGDVLEEDLEVTGPVSARISLSTTATDADVVVRLIDVWPDGRAMSVVSGITRLSRREGMDAEPSPLVPGRIYEIDVDLWATGQLFPAGHRVRVDVAGASFPEFDRNGGDGPHGADAVALHSAHHEISVDPQHPSFLTLPVPPAVT